MPTAPTPLSTGTWDYQTTHLDWRSPDAPPRFFDMLQGVLIMAAIYAAMQIVMLLLALLLVTPFVWFRGENWVEIASGFLDPELWLLGLGIAIAMAVIPPLLSLLFSSVEAFRFDAQTQQLHTTERRAWFAPVTRSWPFAAISAIQPTHSSAFSAFSGLEVTLTHAPGKPLQLMLGDNCTQHDLETQAQWLRPHFGERVLPLVEGSFD